MAAIRGVFALLTATILVASGGLPGQLPLGRASVAYAADWETRPTAYFTLHYTAADAETAAQYAAAVDEIYSSVAAIFDRGPAVPVPLRLYPTLEAYGEANPIARVVAGVVAHADPKQGEIGVATPRLAQASPAQVRDTIRHELTHLAATELSNDRLPIGFQEGLAQYVEREAGERRNLARTLSAAQAQGRLLGWQALNEPRRFVGRIQIAYPQALSVVSYLLDRYGVVPFKGFMVALRESDADWADVLATVYGRSLAELEADWREYLPEYLAGRWEIDVLAPLDLAPAHTRLANLEYEAARAQYAEARRLHLALGQERLATEAARGEQRAENLLAAIELQGRGRSLLSDRAYAAAATLLTQAIERYAAAEDEAGQANLAAALGEARLGSTADSHLAEAEALLASWRFPEGRARSAEAALRYRDLDDAAGWQRAALLQAEADAGQRRLAGILLGAGAALLGVLALVWLAGWRRRRGASLRLAEARAEEGITL